MGVDGVHLLVMSRMRSKQTLIMMIIYYKNLKTAITELVAMNRGSVPGTMLNIILHSHDLMK